MITFYKNDGSISGTIDGRIHSEQHLKMWIGKKEETERIIVNWKAVKDIKDKKGNLIAQDFEPDCSEDQKQIYFDIDKNPSDIFKYKVDVKTKKLILK